MYKKENRIIDATTLIKYIWCHSILTLPRTVDGRVNPDYLSCFFFFEDKRYHFTPSFLGCFGTRTYYWPNAPKFSLTYIQKCVLLYRFTISYIMSYEGFFIANIVGHNDPFHPHGVIFMENRHQCQILP